MNARLASLNTAVSGAVATSGGSGMTSSTVVAAPAAAGDSGDFGAAGDSGAAGAAGDSGAAGVAAIPDGAVVTVTVRYFAAARAAAGIDEEPVTVPAPASVEQVLTAAVAVHGAELKRVLERCSYLKNSIAVHGASTPLASGDALDVLPPFAGG